MKKITFLVALTVLFAACNPYKSTVQQCLIGNWINSQNGNWEYGFYEEFAIASNDYWSYKNVSNTEIVLSNKGKRQGVEGNENITLNINILTDSTITINGKEYFKNAYPNVKKIKHYDQVKYLGEKYVQKMSYFADVKEDTTDFAPYCYNRNDSATIIFYERNTAQGIQSWLRRYEIGKKFYYLDIEKINGNGFIGRGASPLDTTEHFGDRYVFRVPVEGVSEVHHGNLLVNWGARIILPSIIEPNDTLTFYMSQERFPISNFRNEHFASGDNQRFYREQDLFYNYLVSQGVTSFNWCPNNKKISFQERYESFKKDSMLLSNFIAQSKMPLSRKFVHYNKNAILYNFAADVANLKESDDFFKQNPQIFNEQEIMLGYNGFKFVMDYVIRKDSELYTDSAKGCYMAVNNENIEKYPDYILCEDLSGMRRLLNPKIVKDLGFSNDFKDLSGVRRLLNPKIVKDLGFSNDFLELLRFQYFDIYKSDRNECSEFRHNFSEEEKQNLRQNITNEKYRKTLEETFSKCGEDFWQSFVGDFKGDVVIVEFWSLWCGPCLMAMDELRVLEEKFSGKGVEFVFFCDKVSFNEDRFQKIKDKTIGHHFTLSREDFYTLLNNFDEIATPTFVVIGKDGKVKDSHTGFRGVEYYKQKIQEELKK